MIGLTLLTAFGLSAAALVVLCAVATRDAVNPFAAAGFDASADTLAHDSSSLATLAGDWQAAELTSLHEVEDMLDWLENHDVRHTELQAQGNGFLVRWR